MPFEFPASKAGKNAYAHECKPTNQWQNYAVCQFVIEAHLEGRLTGFSECVPKIKDRTCPAIAMIAAEKKAGKILYWEDQVSNRIEVAPPVSSQEDIPDFLRRPDGEDSLLARVRQKAAWGFPPDDGALGASQKAQRVLRASQGAQATPSPEKRTGGAPKPTVESAIAAAAAESQYAAVINKSLNPGEPA